ncbi:MAG: ABC transporter ATP-binding protein [Gemmatimonadota bacterium]|nr:ABC transporter ATP-binding protein [Gemmatimonadota bacterium]
MSEPIFRCRGLTFAYPGASSPAIRDLDLDIGAGRMTALIGPNGAGKSTLVRLLAGTVRPDRGAVAFLGRPLADWRRTELARTLAVVAQEPPPAIPQSVTDYVSLGRNPYVSPWAALAASDERIVEQALARVGLSDLADRRLTDLSGGEIQRAKLARALAQEPEVVILDEPTAHLDIGHALWAFETVADLVDRGMTALCVTHDINLASRYATDLVLLSEGRAGAGAGPAEVLSPVALERAYGCPVEVLDRGELGIVVLPASRSMAGRPRR